MFSHSIKLNNEAAGKDLAVKISNDTTEDCENIKNKEMSECYTYKDKKYEVNVMCSDKNICELPDKLFDMFKNKNDKKELLSLTKYNTKYINGIELFVICQNLTKRFPKIMDGEFGIKLKEFINEISEITKHNDVPQGKNIMILAYDEKELLYYFDNIYQESDANILRKIKTLNFNFQLPLNTIIQYEPNEDNLLYDVGESNIKFGNNIEVMSKIIEYYIISVGKNFERKCLISNIKYIKNEVVGDNRTPNVSSASLKNLINNHSLKINNLPKNIHTSNGTIIQEDDILKDNVMVNIFTMYREYLVDFEPKISKLIKVFDFPVLTVKKN